MRTPSLVDAFGTDLLQGMPWTDVGERVDDTEQAEDRANECRNFGRWFGEPMVRIRGCLLRPDDERRSALIEEALIAGHHAGAVLWTEDTDFPEEFDDEVRLLTADEADLIERNSLTLQLERLRDAHTAESAAALPAGGPLRGVVGLLLERKAAWGPLG